MTVLEAPLPQQQPVEIHQRTSGIDDAGQCADETGRAGVVRVRGQGSAGVGDQEREEKGTQVGVGRGEGGG